MGVRKNREGEVYKTNEGYNVKIIKYINHENCTIMLDNGTILENIRLQNIRSGGIKNPFHRGAEGVGFLGVGKYKGGVDNKSICLWRSMLSRCYNDKYQKRQLTYKGCTVAEIWHNFQNFAAWYEENYNPETMEGWELDKDILIKGNKIYSPEACCFVPREINILLTKRQNNRGEFPVGVKDRKKAVSKRYESRLNKKGKSEYLGVFKTPEQAFEAYKEAKEQYIKETANKYKDQLDSRVYEAMYNYKVEITD